MFLSVKYLQTYLSMMKIFQSSIIQSFPREIEVRKNMNKENKQEQHFMLNTIFLSLLFNFSSHKFLLSERSPSLSLSLSLFLIFQSNKQHIKMHAIHISWRTYKIRCRPWTLGHRNMEKLLLRETSESTISFAKNWLICI